MASVSATTSPELNANTVVSPIAARFANLAAARKRALVCYVTAGHPDAARSLALLQGLEHAGADVIEIGVPFSDPLADGPVIQASSQTAIENGFSLERTLELVSTAKLGVPVVLFSYLNPIIAGGKDVLARARSAGVSGILVTDLPVGADPEREAWIGSSGLDFVRLVAPTTPQARMAEISKHGGGFVYLISRLGVTGERETVSVDLPASIARLRTATTLPICVGFGISTPQQARDVAGLGDGVIVGSALVRAADRSVDEAVALAHAMRTAMDND